MLQIGATVLAIIGLWTYIWAPLDGTGTAKGVDVEVFRRSRYRRVRQGLSVSSFRRRIRTDEGVIAIWKG